MRLVVVFGINFPRVENPQQYCVTPVLAESWQCAVHPRTAPSFPVMSHTAFPYFALWLGMGNWGQLAFAANASQHDTSWLGSSCRVAARTALSLNLCPIHAVRPHSRTTTGFLHPDRALDCPPALQNLPPTPKQHTPLLELSALPTSPESSSIAGARSSTTTPTPRMASGPPS